MVGGSLGPSQQEGAPSPSLPHGGQPRSPTPSPNAGDAPSPSTGLPEMPVPPVRERGQLSIKDLFMKVPRKEPPAVVAPPEEMPAPPRATSPVAPPPLANDRMPATMREALARAASGQVPTDPFRVTTSRPPFTNLTGTTTLTSPLSGGRLRLGANLRLARNLAPLARPVPPARPAPKEVLIISDDDSSGVEITGEVVAMRRQASQRATTSQPAPQPTARARGRGRGRGRGSRTPSPARASEGEGGAENATQMSRGRGKGGRGGGGGRGSRSPSPQAPLPPRPSPPPPPPPQTTPQITPPPSPPTSPTTPVATSPEAGSPPTGGNARGVDADNQYYLKLFANHAQGFEIAQWGLAQLIVGKLPFHVHEQDHWATHTAHTFRACNVHSY